MSAHLPTLQLLPGGRLGGKDAASLQSIIWGRAALPILAMQAGLTLPVFILLSNAAERKINFKIPIKNPFSLCIFGYSSLRRTPLLTDV